MPLGSAPPRYRTILRRAGFGSIAAAIFVFTVIAGWHFASDTIQIRSMVQARTYCTQPDDADCLVVRHGRLVGGWKRHDSKNLDWQLRDLIHPDVTSAFHPRDTEILRVDGTHWVQGLLYRGELVAVVTQEGTVLSADHSLEHAAAGILLFLAGMCVVAFVLTLGFMPVGFQRGYPLPINTAGYYAQLSAFLAMFACGWSAVAWSGPTWVGQIGAIPSLSLILIAMRGRRTPVLAASPSKAPPQVIRPIALSLAILLAAGAFDLLLSGRQQDAAYRATDTAVACGTYPQSDCLSLVGGRLKSCRHNGGGRFGPGREECYLEYGSGLRAYGEFDVDLRSQLEASQGETLDAYVVGDRFHSVFLNGSQYAAYAWPRGTTRMGFGSILAVIALGLVGWVIRRGKLPISDL